MKKKKEREALRRGVVAEKLFHAPQGKCIIGISLGKKFHGSVHVVGVLELVCGGGGGRGNQVQESREKWMGWVGGEGVKDLCCGGGGGG